jgi:hypothetical protein
LQGQIKGSIAEPDSNKQIRQGEFSWFSSFSRFITTSSLSIPWKNMSGIEEFDVFSGLTEIFWTRSLTRPSFIQSPSRSLKPFPELLLKYFTTNHIFSPASSVIRFAEYSFDFCSIRIRGTEPSFDSSDFMKQSELRRQIDEGEKILKLHFLRDFVS